MKKQKSFMPSWTRGETVLNILIMLSPLVILPMFAWIGYEIEAMLEWNELIKQDAEREQNAKNTK